MNYRTCEYHQLFGKVGNIFQIGSRKFKKMLQKIIKMIIKASKVSNRNMNKSLNSMKKSIKRFKIVFFKIWTN